MLSDCLYTIRQVLEPPELESSPEAPAIEGDRVELEPTLSTRMTSASAQQTVFGDDPIYDEEEPTTKGLEMQAPVDGCSISDIESGVKGLSQIFLKEKKRMMTQDILALSNLIDVTGSIKICFETYQ